MNMMFIDCDNDTWVVLEHVTAITEVNVPPPATALVSLTSGKSVGIAITAKEFLTRVSNAVKGLE